MATTTTATTDNTLTDISLEGNLTWDNVRRMLEACQNGQLDAIQELLAQDTLYACQQDPTTGLSPLMVAAKVGNLHLAELLLHHGAPWNALDRNGKCAGNYATEQSHWTLVNFLVDWAVRAELILGTVQQTQLQAQLQQQRCSSESTDRQGIPIDQQSSTKNDYLSNHSLQYTDTALLDSDHDAVMMEWERPIMKAHASILMDPDQQIGQQEEVPMKARVLNIGFGMGIIDSALQEYQPQQHTIIEAHPDVYQYMLRQRWDQKPNVEICFGRWQDVIPKWIEQGGRQYDAIFFDTYAEHSMDMEHFHRIMTHLLAKPRGVYSFFNGLAPDNLFFHGVGT